MADRPPPQMWCRGRCEDNMEMVTWGGCHGTGLMHDTWSVTDDTAMMKEVGGGRERQ